MPSNSLYIDFIPDFTVRCWICVEYPARMLNIYKHLTFQFETEVISLVREEGCS